MRVWVGEGDSWRRVQVDSAVPIGRDPGGRVVVGDGAVHELATIVPFQEHGVARAALVLAREVPDVLRNGYPPLGLSVLEDRDEITVGQAGDSTSVALIVFGAREVPVPAPFPADGTRARCSRCAQVFDPGDVVITCPVCRAPYHAGSLSRGVGEGGEAERFCNEYDPLCSICRRPREALTWTPYDLDEAEGEPGGAGDGSPGSRRPGALPLSIARGTANA